MKQWTSGKVWKFPFVCSNYFPWVQPFSNLSVTSWGRKLAFFPLCAVWPTKYGITYFSPHIFTAFLCPPVLQGQISVLRAVCSSTAWTKPWGQGLFPWSMKCCVLATGSEEEVGKESGRLGGTWATVLKGGKCVGWPGSFWALTPHVFSRAVLVHCGISWFYNRSSQLHPFHWSGNWGMEQKTHFSEYFVISAAHCDQ